MSNVSLRKLAARLAEIVAENDAHGMSERNNLPVTVVLDPLPRKPRQRHKPSRLFYLQYASGAMTGWKDAAGEKIQVMCLHTCENQEIVPGKSSAPAPTPNRGPGPVLHIPAAKSFRVAVVSQNTNDFGLTGVVLVGEDGEAFEAATYTQSKGFELYKGEDIRLPIRSADAKGTDRYQWVSLTGRTFEIPRALPQTPAPILAEIYRKEGK